jgi:esterase/lipase
MDNAEKLITTLGTKNLETLFIENSGHVVLLEPERQRAADAIIEFIHTATRLQR